MPDKYTTLSRFEFIALVAMLTAIVAFSIDAMLPALPEIAQALAPDTPNKAQLIISSFVLGLGFGTLFTGPLSDSFGRKPVVIAGSVLYGIGSLIAWHSAGIETLLAARVLQGIGAAGPRVVAVALVRDLYSGRSMARIMSLVTMIFILVPAVAPSIGAVLIHWLGWRQIFLAFIVFAAIASLWLALRQPETLPREQRRALSPRALWQAAREVLSHPTVRLSIVAQTLLLAMLFSTLSQIQQLFGSTFGRANSFPLWFGAIALSAGVGSVLNARLVMRLGMQRLALGITMAQIVLSGIATLAFLSPLPLQVTFVIFVPWVASIFFQISLSMGNLTALAMEPMGHLAGMATALMSSLATMGAAIIAAPIGQLYDGSPLPLAVATCALSVAASWVIAKTPRDA